MNPITSPPQVKLSILRSIVLFENWPQDKSPLKVLTNEKIGGLKVLSIERTRFKLFTKLSEGCFYYLNTIIVIKYRHGVGGI